MSILVTGTAGFIGNAVAYRLCSRGEEVSGIDNLCDYYDTDLKKRRLNRLLRFENYTHYEYDICDAAAVEEVFTAKQPRLVVHLAAQAGVRHSITCPMPYVETNIKGFLNILEGCRHHRTNHLVYASSSSVYGANTVTPFSTKASVNHPLSLYAASKRANELFAHSYSSLYGLPTSGLRFFTVYGPWGRPDMALYIFTRKILNGEPIDVFNHGRHLRDFTYIEDIVDGILSIASVVPPIQPAAQHDQEDPSRSQHPFRIYNLGSNNPIALERYIELIEHNLKRKATINYMPIQLGDVPSTHADICDARAVSGYEPKTSIEDGVKNFVEWYLEYHAD